MRELYRVITWIPGARAGRAGHPLHVPRNAQGSGRVDNPDVYGVLYASTAPEGAIAEAFGHLATWSDSMLRRPGGGVRALAMYRLTNDRILDLDDPAQLLARALRPSRVVTRDREVTQAWARAIYSEDRWAGVSWWSRYDARWTSVAVWAIETLHASRRVAPLSLTDPTVGRAAAALNRPRTLRD
ncbi:MAG: RES domain-containing protein [Actinomycetota bacterium]